MLDDLSCIELENFEHQLYSQVHHSTCEEYNVTQLDLKSTMPPKKVSYRPVRYFPKRKNNFSSRLQEQQRPKTVDLRDNLNLKYEKKGQSSQTPGDVIHPYPINNILVFPQNSDTLINVISKNNRDFSYKKFFRKRSKQKEKTNYSCKVIQDSDHDVKPNINEIKMRNIRKPANINHHTIILSDSEDDNISFEASSYNKQTIGNFIEVCENKNKNLEKNDISFSTDDDVILIENETVNDFIEIDDCNTEQMTPQGLNNKSDERNEILSTPESSASNDFLENSQSNPNPKFNFSLHGSEFKDNEFLRPTVNIDISESGSISSVSDISSSMKTNVFSLVEFPKEKVNLFDESNMEKFKNSITPQRPTKKTVMEDHDNLKETRNIIRHNQLPTLSDIGKDENSHKRERGRSIIRELVNDRAYVLLSSAEKKMKTKKRKSKDCITNSINETDLSENTLETSKKKKRKKYKKKDDDENDSCIEITEDTFSSTSLDTNSSKNKKHNLLGNNDIHENTEDHENGKHSKRIMIRTDLFLNTDINVHGKNKKEKHNGDEEILEKSEISSKQKKKKIAAEDKVNTTDFCKKSRKDKKVGGHIENDEFNKHNETLKKSHKIEKKDVQYKNDEQIELIDEVNTTLVEKRRKRKKDHGITDTEIIDNTNVEISIDACSVSKRKHKKKRLSENMETVGCHLVVNDFDVEKNCDVILNENPSPVLKPEKIIRQKTLSGTDIPSEVFHTNLKESTNNTSIENIQRIDGNVSKCKHKKNLRSENEKSEKRDQAQLLETDNTSDIVETSPLDIMEKQKNLSSSNLSINDHKTIEKLDLVKRHDESINNTNENVTLVEKNCTISKEPVVNSSSGTTSEEVEHNRIPIDSIYSTESISSEVTYESPFMKENNCINQTTHEKSHTAEIPQSVWNVYPTNFFSSSKSLFTVSNTSIQTNPKNSCDQEKPQDGNVSTALNSSVSIADNSNVNFPVHSSELFPVEVNPPKQRVEGSCGVMQTTEQSPAKLTLPKISSTLTCNVESSEIPAEVKIEDLTDSSLQDENNQLNLLDKANEKDESLLIQEDISEQPIEQVVVKIEPEVFDRIGHKKKQELKLSNTTKSNFPSVAASRGPECGLDVSTSKGRLPEVIENIVSKKDNVTNMRKLCEFLEEVNDPQDVLKKVSMIKEAFLAKSVNTDVNSCISMQEQVNDNDDIFSICSDTSSVVCVESDSSIIDIMDDITLINCESGNNTLIEENNIIEEVGDLQDKNTLEKSKTILAENSPEKKSNTTNLAGNSIKRKEPEKPSLVLRNNESANYKRGLNKYDVEDIQKLMSDDQKLWEISSDDLPQRRYIPKGKRCIKCREIGHLGNMCPNKLNIPRCILCGLEGHLDFKCPNKICTQCGRKSSMMKSICQHCKHYRNLTCSLCKMRGHPRHKCPDLWRRYHLTVEHGPLVQPSGTKLKEKESLWCSFCAKSGHLEHYCFFAQKNRNFQKLDPTVYNYIDIYCMEENNDKNKISKDTQKERTISEKDDTAKTRIDYSDHSTKNNDMGHKFSGDLSQFEVTSRSSQQSYTKAEEGIDISQGVLLKRFATLSSNIRIEGLPEDFVVIDETSELHSPLNEKSYSELEPAPKETNKFSDISNASNESITDSVPSTSTGTKFIDSDLSKDTEETELSKNSKADSFNVNSGSLPKSHINHKIIDSYSDILNLFVESEIGFLKNYIIEELVLLQKSSFKVKQLFNKFSKYENDEKNLSDKRKIPLFKIPSLIKTLNMMLFGRAQLRAGGVHFRKLVAFVNTSGSVLSKSMRESLYCSYEYIFGKTRHAHVNYHYLMKLLLKDKKLII